jgi:hypothetical protein
MTDQTKQALIFIQQALNDYAATLAPSVRSIFIREASQALQLIDSAIPKEDNKQ